MGADISIFLLYFFTVVDIDGEIYFNFLYMYMCVCLRICGLDVYVGWV